MNTSWHDELENAGTVDETVASVRQFLCALPPQQAECLPRCCSPKRIKADDDVDDLTLKLAQAQRESSCAPDQRQMIGEVFDYLLHASLRISQLNRVRANGMMVMPRFARRQMS